MFARIAALALAASATIGCAGSESRALQPVSDSAVVAPVERFVTAGRTIQAYVELADELAVARADAGVGDPATAAQVELRLMSLAAPLVASVRHRPLTEQVATLALTVWPVLLGEPVHANESADDYLARLSAGPLRKDCGVIASADRALVVRAVAMRRADARMRAALATCLDCRSAEWDRIGFTWESLHREATGYVASLRRSELQTEVVASKVEPGAPTL